MRCTTQPSALEISHVSESHICLDKFYTRSPPHRQVTTHPQKCWTQRQSLMPSRTSEVDHLCASNRYPIIQPVSTFKRYGTKKSRALIIVMKKIERYRAPTKLSITKTRNALRSRKTIPGRQQKKSSVTVANKKHAHAQVETRIAEEPASTYSQPESNQLLKSNVDGIKIPTIEFPVMPRHAHDIACRVIPCPRLCSGQASSSYKPRHAIPFPNLLPVCSVRATSMMLCHALIHRYNFQVG